MSKTEHLDGNDEIWILKEKRQKLVERIEDRCIIQEEMMYSLEKLVPNLVSSLDLSMKVISAFRGGDGNRRVRPQKRSHVASDILGRDDFRIKEVETGEYVNADVGFVAEEVEVRAHENEVEAEGSSRGVVLSQSKALSIVKSMVAGVLLSRVPWGPIDSAAILRKLENSPCTNEERSSLVELGGELGAIAAVETSMKSLSDENAGVELEDYELSGKNRIMVLSVDQNRLSKAIPDAARQTPNKPANASGASTSAGADLGRSPVVSRQEMWNGPGEVHPHGIPGGPPPMFHGAMGPRGGGPRPMGMMGGIHGQGMGYGALPPMQRQPPGPNLAPNMSSKPRTEEDDMKDIEALLKKKSFKEMQKSKTGEELFELIHRPTARETALAAKFKTKGGTQLKEYCKALTKEDCRSQRYSNIACEKVHFRRIIAPHTDISLGDCSFLDTCRHMKTCKYVHYELDPTPDIPIQGMSPLPPPKPLRAEYCSEVELGEPQWINCDIRSFRMDILGQFGVIMADPPWDIHMELPYGTMADDEMRNLNVPALQTDGLLFLWVTGRAMELGRECLELWGYRRVEELIWVKTNQLQRIIRTGRTGHWLNHSKEHCLVGIKGNPEVNRNIDTDVIVSEVRETSRKPDEMYPMLERISPRTRKLELFARMHNTHAGWMSLGNQLSGVRLVDEGLRARFKAAYPETEVQPLSPPRSTPAPDGDAVSQGKNRVVGNDAKTTPDRVSTAGPENTITEELSNKDAEMTS